MRLLIAALTLIAAVGAAGCGTAAAPTVTVPPSPTPTATATPTAEPGPDYEALQDAYDAASSEWFTNGARTYTMTFRWVCFCAPPFTSPVRVRVVDDAIASVEYVAAGTATPEAAPEVERYKTVRQLLDMVREAISDRAAGINVEYDPELGYPKTAYIDYEAMVADEEMGWEITAIEFPGRDYGQLQSDLDAAKARWDGLGLTAYSYEFNMGCFCPPQLTARVRVEVEDGEVVRVTYVEGGEEVTEPYLKEFTTVEGLFAKVQQAITNEADAIFASYDPTTGHPMSVQIDQVAMAMDDEMAFTIHFLAPAPVP